MKKLMFIIGSLVLCFGGISFAQELGNSAMLIPKGKFEAGFQGTWVFKQSFDDYNLGWKGSDGISGSTRKSAEFEDDQFYLATLTYGLIDRLNLFAKLGLVDGGEYKESSPDNASESWKASLDANFVWAIGAKGKIYEMQNGIGFLASVQYLRYDNRTVECWESIDTGLPAEDDGTTTDDEMDYWQIDAVATVYWKIERFMPYAGAGFSYSEAKEKGRWTQSDGSWEDYDASFNNENKFSALVGIDVDLVKNFKVNIQGTFVSRTALTLGISYAF